MKWKLLLTTAAALSLALTLTVPAEAKGRGGGSGSKGTPNHSNARPNGRAPQPSKPIKPSMSELTRKHFAKRAQDVQTGKGAGAAAPPGSKSAGTRKRFKDRVHDALSRKN